MPLLTEDAVRAAARNATVRTGKTSAVVLTEVATRTRDTDRFDVFLSHSVRDAEIVRGVVALLEGCGQRVYVDWLTDPQLDRSRVQPATARRLRTRMGQSETLLYLHTEHSSESRWMPWELGYADGLHGRVAILPVLQEEGRPFHRQEYLGIYPYVDRLHGILYVRRNEGALTHWDGWKTARRPDLNP